MHRNERLSCRSKQYISLPPQGGYLSSYISEETGCGLGDTPYRLKLLPGQRVNITLMDFRYAHSAWSYFEGLKPQVICTLYSISRSRSAPLTASRTGRSISTRTCTRRRRSSARVTAACPSRTPAASSTSAAATAARKPSSCRTGTSSKSHSSESLSPTEDTSS